MGHYIIHNKSIINKNTYNHQYTRPLVLPFSTRIIRNTTLHPEAPQVPCHGCPKERPLLSLHLQQHGEGAGAGPHRRRLHQEGRRLHRPAALRSVQRGRAEPVIHHLIKTIQQLRRATIKYGGAVKRDREQLRIPTVPGPLSVTNWSHACLKRQKPDSSSCFAR